MHASALAPGRAPTWDMARAGRFVTRAARGTTVIVNDCWGTTDLILMANDVGALKSVLGVDLDATEKRSTT